MDRKTDGFRTSSIPIDLAVTCCRYLSRCLWLCLGRLFLCLCLLCAWFCSSVYVYVYCVCICAWFVGSFVTVTVGVTASSAFLPISAVYLDLLLRLHLCLLCLYLCLVRRLFRRFVCDCAWVIRSSVCVCYVPGSVFPSAFTFTVCLSPYLHLHLRLLCVCAYAWFVVSSIYVCYVCGCTKSVKKRANQCSISRFTQ